MARLTEQSIRNAVTALVEQDAELAQKVQQDDLAIDEMELKIDQEVTEFILTENPMARDLRLSRVIGMMTTDLERIGDIASRISEVALHEKHKPESSIAQSLSLICDYAVQMLTEVCNSTGTTSEEELRAIMHRDQQLNEMYFSFCEEVQEKMEKDGTFVRLGVRYLNIAHRLERLGDHSKHIAEDLIYLLNAKDIRHEEKLAASEKT